MKISGESGEFSGGLKGTYAVCKNSRLEIGDGCESHSLRVDIADSRVRIGGRSVLGCLEIYARGSEIHIGPEAGFNGYVQVLSHEASRIFIGDNCLFAGGSLVTTSDMHSIVDADTGVRINPAQAVEIGDHVWVGQNAYILKGATIGQGSIIGAASIVPDTIPAKSLAVGSPARVIRTNVTWRHDLIPCPGDGAKAVDERRGHRGILKWLP